ncbi:glycoside hydrolase family 26 protein [Niallia taxi]|uniref:glycoside hydrolase family 26 protein n=1 Tax=Niallia taxi TaxID=2499688 RepID=UPI0015F4CA38|nr:glycosyl hydrolase [Niallia taxi]
MKRKGIILTIILIGLALGIWYATSTNQPIKIALPVQESVGYAPYQHKAPDLYSLWKDEAASKSLQPAGLDTIVAQGDRNQYSNNQLSFSMNIPAQWTIDHHQPTEYVRFFSEDFRIDVTYEDTTKAYSTPDKFLETTLAPIKEFEVKRETSQHNEFNVLVVDYKRPPISKSFDHFTTYTYLFAYNDKDVYTFQLKSREDVWSNRRGELLQSFKTFAPVPYNPVDLNKDMQSKPISNELVAANRNYHMTVPKNSFVQGIYHKEFEKLTELENETSTRFGSQMIYKSIQNEFDPYIVQVLEDGRIPIVSFLFETPKNAKGTSPILSEIISGKYDKYFVNWATNTKRVGGPIYFRIAGEMNGEWTIWNAVHNYNDPDLYKLAYRHIVDIFRHYNADNANFIWNPSGTNVPFVNWNHATMYFPGDSYVHVIGLSGYNFGKSQWSEWKTFDEVFGTLYYDYLRYFSGKPFIIGEYASGESGGNKTEWIQNASSLLKSKYTNIKIAVWFNEKQGEEFNFPFTSSPESTQAIQKATTTEGVISHPITKSTKEQIENKIRHQDKK